MNWPNKEESEQFEIDGFIKAYAPLPEARQFEIVSKLEKPDYILKDKLSGKEYGVELTAVYSDDRSVPDMHKRKRGNERGIPEDRAKIEIYMERIIRAVVEKICKARKRYDARRPLILAIYMNEYISIHIDKSELEQFARRYKGLFDAMEPFTEIVFWNLLDNGAFIVKPS